MKTTTFDQLKSMLKSMSYSIFTRLRIVEKDIEGIRGKLPTTTEIIFTKGKDGNYTCNIPHAELWEMDTDAIAKNAKIINGEEEYSVRGATKKTVSLYGDVIQLYADLNIGAYDIPGIFHRTLILSYFLSILDGTTAMIIPDEVSSLSNSHNGAAALNIPILKSTGVWHNGPADFLVYDSLNDVYTLKTMSENTKGGAMVGEGLKMVGDALTVDEGVYELIETITLTANSAITRTQEPDGTPYKLKKVMVKTQFSTTGAYSAGGAYAYFKCKNTNIGYMWYGDLNINTAATRYHVDNAKIENGKWLIEWQDWTAVATMQFKSAFKDINTYDAKTYDAIDTIQINQILPAGTIIEIWGVRADA